MNTRILVSVVLAAFSLGCAVRRPPQRPSPASQLIASHSFVELQPGWRIRVVVPILKSGGYKVKTEEMPSESGAVQLKTSDDFLGYEIDHYTVASRAGNGITVRFQSSEIHMNNGKSSSSPNLKLPLFQLPPDVRYVRLAFLARLSSSEHDAVILASPSREGIDALTTRIESNPSQACATSPNAICSWVPEGVSVQPEKKQGRKWVPAV